MDDPLPLDVMARLGQDFGDRANAMAALLLACRRMGSADYISDRLLRCIVLAARGDEQRMRDLIDLERQDYRDVIVAGEYDNVGRQVRDLHVSFLIDSPDKFWISGVAVMMDSRGYRLMLLETRPATTGPFQYGCDFAEGRAVFTSPNGEVEIEKRERRWTIQKDPRELEIHDLKRAFDDERAFCDAVSGYLLTLTT